MQLLYSERHRDQVCIGRQTSKGNLERERERIEERQEVGEGKYNTVLGTKAKICLLFKKETKANQNPFYFPLLSHQEVVCSTSIAMQQITTNSGFEHFSFLISQFYSSGVQTELSHLLCSGLTGLHQDGLGSAFTCCPGAFLQRGEFWGQNSFYCDGRTHKRMSPLGLRSAQYCLA